MFGNKRNDNKKSSIKDKAKNTSHFINGEDDYGPIGPPPLSEDAAEKTLGGGSVVTRTDKFQKSVKRSVAVIVAAVVVSAGTVVYFGVSNTMGNNKAVSLAENAQSPAFKTRYSSLGEAAIQAYFRGDSPPISMLSSVSWPTTSDSAQDAEAAGSDSAFVTGSEVEHLTMSRGEGFDFPLPSSVDSEVRGIFPNPREEVLSYYGMIDDTWYKFGLPIIIPDVNNIDATPYLAGPPIFLAMDPLTQVDADISRPDPETPTNGLTFTEVPLSDEAESTISEWASAYAEDNGSALKQISGDSTTRQYRGVGGFSSMGAPSIEWSYEFSNGGENFVVARINFSMTKSGGGNDPFVANQTMDILLDSYSEGSPSISAWGQAGQWRRLSPYMNGFNVEDGNDSEQQINGGGGSGGSSGGDSDSSDSDSDTGFADVGGNDDAEAPSITDTTDDDDSGSSSSGSGSGSSSSGSGSSSGSSGSGSGSSSRSSSSSTSSSSSSTSSSSPSTTTSRRSSSSN